MLDYNSGVLPPVGTPGTEDIKAVNDYVNVYGMLPKDNSLLNRYAPRQTVYPEMLTLDPLEPETPFIEYPVPGSADPKVPEEFRTRKVLRSRFHEFKTEEFVIKDLKTLDPSVFTGNLRESIAALGHEQVRELFTLADKKFTDTLDLAIQFTERQIGFGTKQKRRFVGKDLLDLVGTIREKREFRWILANRKTELPADLGVRVLLTDDESVLAVNELFLLPHWQKMMNHAVVSSPAVYGQLSETEFKSYARMISAIVIWAPEKVFKVIKVS